MDARGNVVVTGGASGLGAVIADALLAQNRGVIVVDRDETTAMATASELEARHGVRVPLVVADLSSVAGIEAAAAALTAPESHVAALINNAGGWSEGDQYPTARPDAWIAAITLDLVAPMLLAQRLWPQLAAAEGAVVNIGSSAGEGDRPYGSAEYGAAKAGLRRFTTSLGDRSDVRVMAVIPGWIGLERAHREFASLTPEQQRAAGPLTPPKLVADRVIHLLDHGCPGEIVELLD